MSVKHDSSLDLDPQQRRFKPLLTHFLQLSSTSGRSTCGFKIVTANKPRSQAKMTNVVGNKSSTIDISRRQLQPQSAHGCNAMQRQEECGPSAILSCTMHVDGCAPNIPKHAVSPVSLCTLVLELACTCFFASSACTTGENNKTILTLANWNRETGKNLKRFLK